MGTIQNACLSGLALIFQAHFETKDLLLHVSPDQLLAGRIECGRMFDLIKIAR
jgi:hypothetical protein